jgi:hypothetical protein
MFKEFPSKKTTAPKESIIGSVRFVPTNKKYRKQHTCVVDGYIIINERRWKEMVGLVIQVSII